MFLPYGTDAPIYHWPKGTVGLIVANVVAFIATVGMDQEHRQALMLVRGDGLHPLEWLTSCFMHADFEHLFGNMIFLWSFGLVVEGKLGWPRFVPLYLAIGVMQSALMQLISLRSEHGYILGASAAICGLLAIAMVWAPRNDLNCLCFIRIVPFSLDIPIVVFAALYIGMEALFVGLTGGAMSSALLHLSGALIGLAAGVLLLKLDIVDCEHWDIFAVMQGRKGMSKSQAEAKRKRSGPSPSPSAPKVRKPPKPSGASAAGPDPAELATRKLRGFLDEGDVMSALAAYDKAMRTVAGWQPSSPNWLELIKGLVEAKEWRTAISVMEDYLRRAEDPSPRVRLKLAQLLIREQQRPAHALRVLAEVPAHSLPDSLEKTRRLLVLQAEQMREEGVLELEGEAW